MPFTISHAAVVLPFSRLLARWRLLSAVVIGAMVPDFGLFVPWRVHRFETHSGVALFTFCLPVGLMTYWAFQYLIKTPMLEVLPDGAYARWRPFSSPALIASVRQWILAGCGILAGAMTHLVWDAFTHENARGVRMIPWLEEPLLDLGVHRMSGVRLMQDGRGVRLMQDGSSLVGLLIVIALVGYGLRRGRDQPASARLLAPSERRAWIAAYAVASSALAVLWYLWARTREPNVPHISFPGRDVCRGGPARTRHGLAVDQSGPGRPPARTPFGERAQAVLAQTAGSSARPVPYAARRPEPRTTPHTCCRYQCSRLASPEDVPPAQTPVRGLPRRRRPSPALLRFRDPESIPGWHCRRSWNSRRPRGDRGRVGAGFDRCARRVHRRARRQAPQSEVHRCAAADRHAVVGRRAVVDRHAVPAPAAPTVRARR